VAGPGPAATSRSLSGGITLTSLAPDSLAVGGPPATVDVYGAGFDASCTAEADTIARTTFFLDAGHVQFTARPDTETGAAVRQVTVVNTAGDISNPLPLTFTGPPATTSIAFWECPCGLTISSSQPLPAAPICICERTMVRVAGVVPQVLYNVIKVAPQNQRNR
jgi:hypothetical protein